MTEYIPLNSSRNAVFVTDGALGGVEAIIFDCDGVLIDTKDSYDKAVLYTAGRLISTFLGVEAADLYSRDDLYALRGTGGFNNDWDLTYALVSYTLAMNSTMETERELLESSKDSLTKKLTNYGSNVEYTPPDFIALSGLLDTSGLESLSAYYRLKGLEDRVSALDKVLGYPGDVGESLVTTMFEEVFCGARLFRRIYGREPGFWKEERGLIENEHLIVTMVTLEELTRITGGRLGIASGSLKAQAEYILEPFLGYFTDGACIWMDNVDEEERRTGVKGLKKPSPYSLTAAVEPFGVGRLLYVGDTMADLVMARNAKELNVVFAGVYGDGVEPEKTKTDFIEAGADLVIPSVNDLPWILGEVR
jgi:phosphoglycolate phosphatase-like HAD superfamily hydrolase